VGFLLPTLAAGQRPRHQQHPGRRRGGRMLDQRRRLLHAIRPGARSPRGGTAVDDGRRLAGPGGRPPSRPQPRHLNAGPAGHGHYAALGCVGRVSRCSRNVRASQRSLLISVLRIPDPKFFHPGSWIPAPGSKRFPDSASASKNFSILTQKIVSNISGSMFRDVHP
jgi:hypothetical protein